MSEVVDTQVEIVPAGQPRAASRWLLVAVPLVVASVAPTAFLAQKFIRSTDMVTIAPGGTTSATKRVRTGELQRYDAEGTVLFVTVGLQGQNELSLDMAEKEPTVDLFTREQLYGNKTKTESRKEDLKLMRYSKDFAAYVALKRLGYTIKLSAGGAPIASMCLESDAAGACTREGPAAKVLKKDDVITMVDGDDVHLAAEINAALADRRAGDVVPVRVLRGTETLDVEVELVESNDKSRAIIGFVATTDPLDTLKFELPAGVSIESGEVGGPSAGLAFTLALLDQLSPGELTGGQKIAVTGEIRLDGRVGEIGGLRQKAVAVQRAGATLFLVPKSQVAEAEKQLIGSKLTVIGVETLDEALDVLSSRGGSGLPLAANGG